MKSACFKRQSQHKLAGIAGFRKAVGIGLCAAVLLGLSSTGVADTEHMLPVDPRLVPPSPGGDSLDGGHFPGGDPFHLLVNSQEVQHELNLSEKQITHLVRVSAGFRTKMRESSPEQAQALAMENREKVAKVLTPEQLDRFRQILLRIGAPCSILQNDPDSGARLRLFASQMNQIRSLCQTMQESLHKLAEDSNRRHPGDNCAAMDEVRAEEARLKSQLQEDVDKLLTDSQKESYLALQGKPFDFAGLPPPDCAK